MESVYRCCCGLDVHKKTAVACLLTTGTDGRRTRATRTFGTMVADLVALREWLIAAGCEHAAMESTGVYWKPVYNVLTADSQLQVSVVNAQHVRAVPGRKTDVTDSAWLADLLQHGLLKASFIPDHAQRALRDLTRTRTSLTDERTAVVNRLQKVLEDANIKLAAVASDVTGVSGRLILTELLAGHADPGTMAELAKGRLRSKRAELERALAGRLGPHHRLLIRLHLEQIDLLDEQIAALDAEVAVRTRPFEDELRRLDTIPGVGRRLAEILIAEIGVDMTHFPSARHLASWAGMCPGNHQSANKHGGGKRRRGSVHLRRALAEAGHAAARNKQPGRRAIGDLYRRVLVRHGAKKAVVAAGHAIAVAAFYVLLRQVDYRELDPVDRDSRHRARIEHRALSQLHALGYHVALTPREAA